MSGRDGVRRLAIVTGASRGLGAVLAGFLAGEGYDLIVTARGAAPLLERAEGWHRDFGVAVRPIAGDVRDPAHRAAIEAQAQRAGRVDLLVNNASELGPTPLPRLVDAPPEAFDAVLAVNLLAPLALVRGLRPWLARASGLVVNVSSDAARGGYPGWGVYGASKAALDLASKTLAEELRAERIAVVSVDPGDMRTEMARRAFGDVDLSDRPAPEVTLPFWAWLLAQPFDRLSGQRFEAQTERWEIPA
ncbi:MAG TPA: SDR family NAD(P)-dependent oxidoreductase [Thermoplasmata archaeon]